MSTLGIFVFAVWFAFESLHCSLMGAGNKKEMHIRYDETGSDAEVDFKGGFL